MNITHHKVKPFIDMLHNKVSHEFKFRIYNYETVDILTIYFRGFKVENIALVDKYFWKLDDKERWRHVSRLRKRITAIKRPSDYRIAREILNVKNQANRDIKKTTSIAM